MNNKSDVTRKYNTHAPKRPKVIILDNYVPSTARSIDDNTSFDEVASHDSSTTSMSSFIRKILL